MEQVYIVLLKKDGKIIDETSVDAESSREALQVASDVFKDFHPKMELETIKANLEIFDTFPVTEDE